VKVFYRQTADEDVIRQFRYYLLTLELPEVALRFRDSVRDTVELLRKASLYWAALPLKQSAISKSSLMAR